jgi:diaminopimelate decarboxylase
MDAGAYFVPFSTSFSFPRPAIVMCDDSGVTTARIRESYDDLVRLDAPTEPA